MSKSEAEVKPYGTSEHPQIPREAVVKTRTRRVYNADLLKNPLTATLLGMTLGLLLLSLSHLRPFSLSNWLPWSAAWWSTTEKQPLQMDASQAQQRAQEMYESGKSSMDQAKDRASEMYQNVRDKVTSTVESVMPGMPGYTYSTEANLNSVQQAACNTAERARDITCNPSKYTESAKQSMGSAKDTVMGTAESAKQAAMDTAASAQESIEHSASDVQSRASEIYESAKQKANEMFDAAKHTVTYPLHAAQETGEATRQAARDTVESARERAASAGEAVVHAAKDTAQAAKDTVSGAGERAKEAVEGVLHRAKETVLPTGSKEETTRVQRERTRPTEIKVEVKDL